MKHRTAIGLLALSLFVPSFYVQSLTGARAVRPAATTAALENETLSRRFPEPGSPVLTNTLTGRSYALSAEPFVLLLEIAGNRIRAAARDSLLVETENVSPVLLRFRYDGVGGRRGLAVFVDYELGEQTWYVRKRVTVSNGLREVVVIHDATIDDVGLQEGAFPAKAQNPMFLDGQVFWGMEWPIAEAAVQDGRFRLTHFLWKGEETYIDVHIANTTAALYNRSASIGRELTSEFFKTPFRQFEDHGICFNSSVEKWADDLVAQAFGRASVLSPEFYGTFFFLPDEDYPRLARLLQLHKRSESMLKHAFPLADGDIAHGDGRSSLLVLRNPTWGYQTKVVRLDGAIGLAAELGTPLTIRQRYPHEFLISNLGTKAGEPLRVELEPFAVRMIQVDVGLPDEPYLGGVPYEIVPGPNAASFDIKVLGEPGQQAAVSFHNFGGRSVVSEGRAVNAAEGEPWRIRFPGRPPGGKPFSRSRDFVDAPLGGIDGSYLAELAKFTVDDDALEIREMDALSRAASTLPEIEVCRDYMRRIVITAEGSARNAFDGDPATRWSDGYARRSEFTGSPAPYRSDASLWRIDLGGLTDLRKLALHIVRRTEDGFLEAVETSPDLKTWARADGLSLEAAQGIPLFTELRQRGRRIKVFDVEVGDNKPVLIEVPLPPGRCRYVRIRGRNFSVSEILGYDGQGRHVDRGQWHATNFFGETPRPGRVLKAQHALAVADYRPGQEFAVAVHAGPARFDPVDGVYVAAVIDGKVVVPRHRVPAYPYHNYEWNSSWLKTQKLGGMTFRLPAREEWAGKTVEFYVMLFGDGLDAATAELHLVTPREQAVERRLQVRSAPAARKELPALSFRSAQPTR